MAGEELVMHAVHYFLDFANRIINIHRVHTTHVVTVETIYPRNQFISMIVDLFPRWLQAICIKMLLDIVGIGNRSHRDGLVLALGERFDHLEALAIDKRDHQILLVEPSEVFIECDEMLLHVALIINQVRIQLFHDFGFVDQEMQLADSDECIGTAAKVELCPEELIHNHDIVMPDVTFLFQDLDFLARDAVLAHRYVVFQETERLQQGITR